MKNSNSKHTPGPWRLLPARTLTNIKGQNGEQIGQLDVNSPDAALIAAAPELLENFEKAIKLIEHISEKFNYCVSVTISDGYALINKARGEK